MAKVHARLSLACGRASHFLQLKLPEVAFQMQSADVCHQYKNNPLITCVCVRVYMCMIVVDPTPQERLGGFEREVE